MPETGITTIIPLPQKSCEECGCGLALGEGIEFGAGFGGGDWALLCAPCLKAGVSRRGS